MGSFWRVMEMASVTHQSIKLALQGSIALAAGAQVLGGFLSASYLCIHPQQQAQFIVCSTSGLRQANRKRSSSISDGPNSLSLLHHLDDDELLPPPFNEQPCSAAFNPFFPGLLLVAYAAGDLALFDCSLCVPITHWGGAVPKSPSRSVSVAWSPRRPCVFFVKSGDTLDVWDLADRNYAATLTVDIAGTAAKAGSDGDSSPCAELFVAPCGRPVVGHEGASVLYGLPTGLVTPLENVPAQHRIKEQAIDDLLVKGYESVHGSFPSLSRHCREVEVPEACALEKDLLRSILLGAQPMQAWI